MVPGHPTPPERSSADQCENGKHLENFKKQSFTEADIENIVAASDSGARMTRGGVGLFVAAVALGWSLYQIVLASPWAPYLLTSDLINNSRQIHLAFAMFLSAMAYPLWRSAPRHKVPAYDWVLAIAGASCALYGYFFYGKIAGTGGVADQTDAGFALVGLVLLLIAAYRTLGSVMVALAVAFLLYVFFGASDLVPDQIRWAGASVRKAMSHMWITPEGVFGIALGVSTKFVFLFVLFGALLDKAGAGNYFIKMAFGALGHLRGGPAKAAVVGSAATGLISGSSVANVVTTGTFTIPLMKRVGFSAEKAGAVEVASSVNGQIMPPVMGAAAFLMVEYVGISYVEVITHAFLPATISYIALLYMVHLEAVKNRMPTIGARSVSMAKTVGGMFAFFAGFALLCYAVKYPVMLVTSLVPDGAAWILSLMVAVAYLGLTFIAAGVPDLEPDDPNAEAIALPDVSRIYKAGLHYLLPIVVLVYFLMIERKSPGLSAFWASALLFFILMTQKPLKALFRGEGNLPGRVWQGCMDLIEGLILGARNMISIGLATATAGIIVGTVSLTGFGQVLAEFVEYLSGGNLILMLVLVALLSLILGMGLPTTANYIVVSSLTVAVVVELGAQSGLIVPLIAVHLFVFYFGIMADVTPPVGLASFAAAAISGGDAIRTGLTASFYSLRTAALPFVFIFNTDLLLIDVTPVHAVFVFVISTIGILVFTAATMRFWITRNRIWETVALLLVAFTLFRPGFFMDMMQPPFHRIEATELETVIAAAPAGSQLRAVIRGPGYTARDLREMTIVLDIAEGDARTRLDTLGLLYASDGTRLILDEPMLGKPVSKRLARFDFYGDDPVEITSLLTPANQTPKELLFLPALLLLGLVFWTQRRRLDRERQSCDVA